MGSTGSPETSVSNHLTPRNNPEDGGFQETIYIWEYKGSKFCEIWRIYVANRTCLECAADRRDYLSNVWLH